MDADCLVIGGGPAGLAAAITAKDLGLAEVLLLEKGGLPADKPCAGGLSPKSVRLLAALGLGAEVKAEGQAITRLSIVTARGKRYSVSAGSAAYVLPRRRFSGILTDAAVRAGVTLIEGAAARPVLNGNGTVLGIIDQDREYNAPVVIAADGIRRAFSAERGNGTYLFACMSWFEGNVREPETAHMIFDTALAPHYGWIFPESGAKVNVGISATRNSLKDGSIAEKFESFVTSYLPARMNGFNRASSLLYYPMLTSAHVSHKPLAGLLLAGEACGLVNMYTGEGIGNALLSGKLAAETAVTGIRSGWSRAMTARFYAAGLRQKLGTGLLLGGILSRSAGIILENKFLFERLARKKAGTVRIIAG